MVYLMILFLTAMLVGAVLQITLLDSASFTQKFTRNALGCIKLDQIGSDRTGFFLVTSDKKKLGYTFANIHSSKRVTVILNQMLIRIGV